MSDGRTTDERARRQVWLALAAPALVWFVFEVGLAGALRLSCATVGNGLGAAWGIGSLLACALAAWHARGVRLGQNMDGFAVWLADVAVVAAALFAVAITFQTVAAIIVPSCAR